QHQPRLSELSETEMTRVAAGMWDNLGRVAAEYPHLLKIRVFEAGGRVEKYGFEHVDRAVAGGRRIIVFSGHIANWEIAMLCRHPARNPGGPDLSRRQQSVAGPHDRAVPR